MYSFSMCRTAVDNAERSGTTTIILLSTHCLYLGQIRDRSPCYQACPEFRTLPQPCSSLSLTVLSDRGCPRPQKQNSDFPRQIHSSEKSNSAAPIAISHCETLAMIKYGRFRNSIFPDSPASGPAKTSCFIICLAKRDKQYC